MSIYAEDSSQSLVGFSCIDLGTGRFYVDSCHVGDLGNKLAFIRPAEVLISGDADADGATQQQQVIQRAVKRYLDSSPLAAKLTSLSAASFAHDPNRLSKQLSLLFNASHDVPLLPLGLPKSSKQATSCLLQYIADSHSGTLPLLSQPTPFDCDLMVIDAESQKSLELLQSSRRNEKSRSLLSLLDSTVTPQGKALLARRVSKCFNC